MSFYRALLDPTAPRSPGRRFGEVLGYGDREEDLRVEAQIVSPERA
jgi:hypothetical protein